MAHLPIITDVYRAAIEHSTNAGETSTNVIHILATSTTPSGVAIGLDAHMTAACWGELHADYVNTQLRITKLDGTSPTQVFPVANPSRWVGGASGQKVPEAAWGLTLYSSTRGRSARGRLFIGPVSESQIDDGRFTSTGVTDATAAWGTYLNDLVSASSPLMIASYKLATAYQITHVTGRLGVRTQRQRLVRARGLD